MNQEASKRVASNFFSKWDIRKSNPLKGEILNLRVEKPPFWSNLWDNLSKSKRDGIEAGLTLLIGPFVLVGVVWGFTRSVDWIGVNIFEIPRESDGMYAFFILSMIGLCFLLARAERK